MVKMIVTHPERCLGCKTCELECAMAHANAQTLVEIVRSKSRPQSRIHVEALGDFGMPMQCRHCEDAPCIRVCPTDALHRFSDDGPVLLVAERCIGCRLCLIVCPFGVIEMSRSRTAMVKCDQCVQRTEVGQDPACVSGCPTAALEFTEVAEYLRQRRRAAAHEFAAPTQIADSVTEK